MRPEPIVKWPTSELPICPGGRPTAAPEASSVVCGYSAQSRSKTGVSASSTAFPGPGGASPQPSRMTSATRLDFGIGADLAWPVHLHRTRSVEANRRERFHVERRAADEGAVDVRKREELPRVLGLHRAAVEHGHVEQAFDELVRLLGDLRCRGLACPDRPDRLVGEDEVVLGLEHGDLAPEDVLGLAGLALGPCLADTGDHGEAGVERGPGASRDALVRLAEELPPLRVADDRTVDAELAQHRRRDLAREGALRLPVDVLGSDGDLCPGQ